MNLYRISLKDVLKVAGDRPIGYLDDLLANGRQEGDWIIMEPLVYHTLRAKYSKPRGGVLIRPFDGAAQPPPEPPLADPTPAQLTGNFSAAVGRWAQAGFPVVSREVYQARAAACAGCTFWDPTARLGLGKCKHPKCGCTKAKLWLATERCPEDLWPAPSMQTPGTAPENPPPGPPSA